MKKQKQNESIFITVLQTLLACLTIGSLGFVTIVSVYEPAATVSAFEKLWAAILTLF